LSIFENFCYSYVNTILAIKQLKHDSDDVLSEFIRRLGYANNITMAETTLITNVGARFVLVYMCPDVFPDSVVSPELISTIPVKVGAKVLLGAADGTVVLGVEVGKNVGYSEGRALG